LRLTGSGYLASASSSATMRSITWMVVFALDRFDFHDGLVRCSIRCIFIP
jgi:hypothetical protein